MFIVKWNLKEAGGNPSVQRTGIAYKAFAGRTSLRYKTKFNTARIPWCKCGEYMRRNTVSVDLDLAKFDKLLESRGHKFVRYADNCNIYVRTKRAAQRVMAGCVKYLEETMKLKVTRGKSRNPRPRQKLKTLQIPDSQNHLARTEPFNGDDTAPPQKIHDGLAGILFHSRHEEPNKRHLRMDAPPHTTNLLETVEENRCETR